MAEGSRRRKAAPYAPPRFSSRLYVRVAPEHQVLLKFLLEGHGHLGVLTAVDRHAAVIRLLYSPDQEREVRAFLEETGQTVPLEVAYRPAEETSRRPAGQTEAAT